MTSRVTIEMLPDQLMAAPELLQIVADRGRRRHKVWGFNFDGRPRDFDLTDTAEPADNARSRQSEKVRMLGSIAEEFGSRALDRKSEDFTAIGSKPMTLLTYHSELFDQVRSAFVAGAYYPALTGACALGERILNHLIIDLREDFQGTPEYKRVHRKSSFDNWDMAIDVLSSWNVLLPAAAAEFRLLAKLRNRSIHFTADAYGTVRKDALSAILSLGSIIGDQFGTFGQQPWFIPGVRGSSFIKREHEATPFVKRYLLPKAPFVGINVALQPGHVGGWAMKDFDDYGDGELSDEEFRDAYNTRDPAGLAKF